MGYITGLEFADIIESCAREEKLRLPRSFRDDLASVVEPDDQIGSMNRVSCICRRIRRDVLACSEKLESRYSDVVSIVSTPVRFKVACALGFEDIVNEAREEGSTRGFLRAFIGQLEPGAQWTVTDLKRWEYNGVSGSRLYYRIHGLCGWNLDVVKVIIGDDAEEMLAKNPCATSFKSEVLTYPVVAKKYLKLYLQSLDQDETWNTESLSAWPGKNGVTGNALYYWMVANFEGGLNSKILKQFLGRSDVLLSRHPYTGYEKKINSLKDVRAYLVEFLRGLQPGEAWWSSKLDQWQAKDGFRGRNIRFYVDRNVEGGFCEATLRQILKGIAPLLDEYVFILEKDKVVVSQEQVKQLLVEFLSGLDDGESWHPAKLRRWANREGVPGENVYRWIRNNLVSRGGTNWNAAMTNMLPQDVLSRNPFCIREVG